MPSTSRAHESIEAYVQQHRQTLFGLRIPSLLGAASTGVIAAYETWKHAQTSSLWALWVLIVVAAVVLYAKRDIDAGIRDTWRYVMTPAILGYVFVVNFVLGSSSVLLDLANIRLGSFFLGVFVARTPLEAVFSLAAHFAICLGCTGLPNYLEEMIMLLLTDIFLLFAGWGRRALAECLVEFPAVWDEVALQSANKVQDTLKYLCDAVVVVNEDLRLVENCPELGAMLGRTDVPSGRSLQEMCHHDSLDTLVNELELHFQAWREGDEVAHASMQVRLSDVYGQPVSVHAFVATVGQNVSAERKPYAIVGISEQWNRKKKDQTLVSTDARSSSSEALQRTRRRVAPKLPARTNRLTVERTKTPLAELPGSGAG